MQPSLLTDSSGANTIRSRFAGLHMAVDLKRLMHVENMTKFTVDTHIFRELGEYLVGRNSTALLELLKNSYDADAKRVTVYGSNLTEVESGLISVSDDGTGMTEGQFLSGFLRLASRTKVVDDRRSRVFGRRFTGAKGIGRLAAHKLARVLSVQTVPGDGHFKPAGPGTLATIDWDKAEEYQTLDEVNSAKVVEMTTIPIVEGMIAGTEIRLQKLRKAWTKQELGRFLR